MVDAVVMSHVVKIVAEVMEAVVVAHQFSMVMVPIIFQTGKKCRLHNGRCKTFRKQGRFRVYQIKTTWAFSLCHV